MRSLIGACCFVLCAPTAVAHHGPGRHDRTAQLTLKGTVAEYEWANPHVYIWVEVVSDTGEPELWQIEANPPTLLQRLGWAPDTLIEGDLVIVSGHPSRSAEDKSMSLVSIQKEDGTALSNSLDFSRFSELQSPSDTARATRDLSGTWFTSPPPTFSAQIGIGPLSSALTEKGADAFESFDQDTMYPSARCIQFPAPVYMILPQVMEIVVDTDVVTIRSEIEGAERVVHMNRDSHEGAARSLHGHSIGFWRGDVLVVDTERFAENPVGNGFGIPSGAGKHLVEHFELAPDGTTMTYRFVLEDPEYLAEPIENQMRWTYRPDLEYSPVECDLDNASRFTEAVADPR